jgi:hypothetical protein
MVCLVHRWILIQSIIMHDPVDEVVDHGGDVVDTAKPVIERGTRISFHGTPRYQRERHMPRVSTRCP